MLCPYCGDEMDKGFVQSVKKIFWTRKWKKIFWIPDSSKDDIIISGDMNGWTKEAYLCKNCKKITIDLVND